MKEKMIMFVSGLLVGAVLSTGSIYVYTLINKSNSTSNNQTMQMPSGDMGGGGQMNQNGNGTTPPEIPSGNGGNTTNNTAA